MDTRQLPASGVEWREGERRRKRGGSPERLRMLHSTKSPISAETRWRELSVWPPAKSKSIEGKAKQQQKNETLLRMQHYCYNSIHTTTHNVT